VHHHNRVIQISTTITTDHPFAILTRPDIPNGSRPCDESGIHVVHDRDPTTSTTPRPRPRPRQHRPRRTIQHREWLHHHFWIGNTAPIVRWISRRWMTPLEVPRHSGAHSHPGTRTQQLVPTGGGTHTGSARGGGGHARTVFPIVRKGTQNLVCVLWLLLIRSDPCCCCTVDEKICILDSFSLVLFHY